MGKWRDKRVAMRQRRGARLAFPMLEAGEVVEVVVWVSDDAPDRVGNSALRLVVLTNRSVLVSDRKAIFEKPRLEARKPRSIRCRVLDSGRTERAVSIDDKIYFMSRPSFATFDAFVAACDAERDEARGLEQAAADAAD